MLKASIEDYDNAYIDPETGEIKDNFTFKADHLPMIARQVRAIDGNINTIRKYMQDECNRIVAHCEAKINSLEQSREFLIMKALPFVPMDQRKLDLPGIGVFKWKKGSEIVDSRGYDDLEEGAKCRTQGNYEECFRTKTTVTPDKNAIKVTLKNGGKVPGFMLYRKADHFDFKGDKG